MLELGAADVDLAMSVEEERVPAPKTELEQGGLPRAECTFSLEFRSTERAGARRAGWSPRKGRR